MSCARPSEVCVGGWGSYLSRPRPLGSVQQQQGGGIAVLHRDAAGVHLREIFANAHQKPRCGEVADGWVPDKERDDGRGQVLNDIIVCSGVEVVCQVLKLVVQQGDAHGPVSCRSQGHRVTAEGQIADHRSHIVTSITAASRISFGGSPSPS